MGSINHPYDIFIVGLRIVNVRQVTKEDEDALESSTEILYIDKGFGVH
jgi:hypothetical protein